MGISEARCDVLVAGAYFADLIFRDLPRTVAVGRETFAGGFEMLPGGAFNPAMALHRLGDDVVWATDFGNDEFSRHVLDGARAAGLPESGFRHHPGPVRSVTVALSYSADRAMVSFQDPVTPRPVDELVRVHRPRILVLPELRYGPGVVETLRAVREAGTSIFMDCQDVPVTLETPTVREVLACVDVFAPNVDEALRLTGAATPDDAATLLGELVSTVLIKRGKHGAFALRAGNRIAVPAVPVRVVDTTGSGDCFNAGFVHGLLAGWDLPRSLAAAVACGSAAATAPGSGGALDADELSAWLAPAEPVPPLRATQLGYHPW
ncbi:carbohydrate kinase family protein (plasmid) [Embleya sp. NBC_00888]|uniref:carbohydrate kinase family protein n=1 Tax=Embleya sp. NBC_00888 TaxID=2975960 RepID=UPI002F9140B3|nr:carbohydrate kinase family protein [Embleya sp. NBC_00888]